MVKYMSCNFIYCKIYFCVSLSGNYFSPVQSNEHCLNEKETKVLFTPVIKQYSLLFCFGFFNSGVINHDNLKKRDRLNNKYTINNIKLLLYVRRIM